MEEGTTYTRESTTAGNLAFGTSNVKNYNLQVKITSGASLVDNFRILLGRGFEPSISQYTMEMHKSSADTFSSRVLGCQNENGVDWVINIVDGDNPGSSLPNSVDYEASYSSKTNYLVQRLSGNITGKEAFRIDGNEDVRILQRVTVKVNGAASSKFTLVADTEKCAGAGSQIQSFPGDDGSRVMLLPGGRAELFWLLLTLDDTQKQLSYEATVEAIDDSQNTLQFQGGWSENIIVTRDVVRYFQEVDPGKNDDDDSESLKYFQFFTDNYGGGELLLMATRDTLPTSIKESEYRGRNKIVTCPGSSPTGGQWSVGVTLNETSVVYHQSFKLQASSDEAFPVRREKKSKVFNTDGGHTQIFLFEMPSDQVQTIDIVISVLSTAGIAPSDGTYVRPTILVSQGDNCRQAEESNVNLKIYDFDNQAYLSKVTIPDNTAGKRWFIMVHVPLHFTTFQYNIWPTSNAPSNIPDDEPSAQGDGDGPSTTSGQLSNHGSIFLLLVLVSALLSIIVQF